jgi:ribosomal protein S18 acetylase RimI-like enzyme
MSGRKNKLGMIRQGEDKDKEALKAMWKLCFPDDADEFTAFYFDRVCKNDETLVYVEDNQLLASLQMIPYSIKSGTTISPAAYISGAMTHPGFRRKGYMSRLLSASFEIMKTKGYDYTFLIPQKESLFGFYEKRGYVKAFPEKMLYLSPVLPSHEGNVPVYNSLQSLSCREWSFWKIYSGFLMEKPEAVLKTESQFAHILWSFFNDHGVLFANEAGWAFTFREGAQIVLKEFFYRDETVRNTFLQSIQAYYALEKLVIFNSPDAPFVRYKGMIKPLKETKKPITGIYASMMLD